jgi:hypothetical protein
VAVRSPKPATNHQLGKLLPYQQLNSTLAPLNNDVSFPINKHLFL